MSRIQPLEPPYEPSVEQLLAEMMPPGQPPIALFRTFARNEGMTRAMRDWGRYELGRDMLLTRRERELIIDRTTARCGCEYEWGVHVAFFASRVGLTENELRSITHGSAEDDCWTVERERLLLLLVDALHDDADVDDDLWNEIDRHFTAAEALDALMMCGWYHAISYVANAARVDLESNSPRFATVARSGTAVG